MKKNLFVALACIASFGLGYFINGVKSSVNEKFAFVDRQLEASSKSNDENFDIFITKFLTDSSFQMERIKFPLKSEIWEFDEVDSSNIEMKDWEIIRLYMNDQYRPQLYDNFDREMRNTDERLFVWHGIENGINVEYRFQRVNGLWYLTTFRDLST